MDHKWSKLALAVLPCIAGSNAFPRVPFIEQLIQNLAGNIAARQRSLLSPLVRRSLTQKMVSMFDSLAIP